MESGNDLHQNGQLVKKLSSPSPVILFNTCLEWVAEACNAEITNLLRLQLTPDSVHKLLFATASLLLEFWSAVNIESEKELTAWIDWSTVNVNLSKARLLRALSCTNLPAKKSRTNYQCCKWYPQRNLAQQTEWIHQDPFWDTKIAVFEVGTVLMLTDLSDFLKALKPALGLRGGRTNKGSQRRIWAQDRCWKWVCMGRGQRGWRGPPPPPARTRTKEHKNKNKDNDRKPTNNHLVSSL